MITPLGEIVNDNKNTILKMWQVNVKPATRMLQEHRHVNFEISLILEGDGIYHTVYGDQSIERNNIFVFSSNEPHCITKIGENGLKLINLHFSRQFIIENSFFDKNYPNIFYNHSKEFNPKINNSELINKCISDIKNELNTKNIAYQSVIKSYLELIFIELMRTHSYLPNEKVSDNIGTKIFESIDYIDKNFDTSITLEDIAKMSGITPNYFSKLFKDYININLWDYITAKRVEKAKKMINEKTDETMLSIAISCGFNNTANFNRAFKAHTGLTPSEFKKTKHIILH